MHAFDRGCNVGGIPVIHGLQWARFKIGDGLLPSGRKRLVSVTYGRHGPARLLSRWRSEPEASVVTSSK